MKVRLGELVPISRGLHLVGGEKELKNLEQEGITEARVLKFSSVWEYSPRTSNTIKPISDEMKVYVNLNKRYKNSRPQNFDVILPVKATSFSPRMIYHADDTVLANYIYSNDILFLRIANTANTVNNEINHKFLFYLLNTSKFKEILNEKSMQLSPKRLTCSILENIELEIPGIKAQNAIADTMDRLGIDLETIIK